MGKAWSVGTMAENDARSARIRERQAHAKGVEEGRSEGIAEGEARFAALAGWPCETGSGASSHQADAWCRLLIRTPIPRLDRLFSIVHGSERGSQAAIKP